MEKVNLYINSKNRYNNDNIDHINISLPNGLLSCNTDEYFILNVNSFYTCANWYNCTSRKCAWEYTISNDLLATWYEPL